MIVISTVDKTPAANMRLARFFLPQAQHKKNHRQAQKRYRAF